MQVETSYTFKNYLYIVISGFFSQNKVKKICLISRLLDWDDYSQLRATRLVRAIYHLISNMACGIILLLIVHTVPR